MKWAALAALAFGAWIRWEWRRAPLIDSPPPRVMPEITYTDAVPPGNRVYFFDPNQVIHG